jgi:hypothetical protein
MPIRTLRTLTVASLAVMLAGCGDSTGPNVTLNDEQVADMMEAMANAGVAGFVPPGNLAVVTINESVECPNGGTVSIAATIDENTTTGAVSMTITQGFAGCKSASSSGRVWTFNGKPNIVTTFSGSENAATGVFSMNGTQKGGVSFASELGSGACDFDITFSMSGNDNTGQFSSTMSGTVCGRSVSQSISG